MSQLKLNMKDLIKPDEHEIKAALLAGDYIICCSLSDPSDLGTNVLENVTTLKESIPEKC